MNDKKGNKIEYSKIGRGTGDLDRISNVIGNIDHAAFVEDKPTLIGVHFLTKYGKKVSHHMLYEIDKANLTDEQLSKVTEFLAKESE